MTGSYTYTNKNGDLVQKMAPPKIVSSDIGFVFQDIVIKIILHTNIGEITFEHFDYKQLMSDSYHKVIRELQEDLEEQIGEKLEIDKIEFI